MDELLARFGVAVRQKREELDLTQEELGEKLGLSYRTIMKIENAQSNSKFETVAMLAQGLSISLDAIVLPSSVIPNQVSQYVFQFFADVSPQETMAYLAILESIKKLKAE